MRWSDAVRGLAVAAVLATAGVLAGCGNSGVTLQGGPSRAPSSSSQLPAASATATPVTTGFGAAQPAVDTVVAMTSAYNTAVRSAQTSTSAAFDQFLVGQALFDVDKNFAIVKSNDLGVRGTPPALRIAVTSSTTAPGGTKFVFLTNCPLMSAIDPASSYYVKTGKPYGGVPVPASAPQPWPETIKLFQANGVGPWKITYIASDSSKTCHA